MKNKISSIALSVLIAFGLWGYVITTVSPGYTDTFYNIPVVKEGSGVLEDRNLIITYQSSDNVDVTVSGNRTDVNKVDSSNITVKVDVSKIDEPGTMIPARCNVTFPGDVPNGALTTESISPDTIYFTVEERREKQVPVEVEWIGSTPEGFMSDRENRILDYGDITVSGPASVADLIEKAVVEVDLTEQRESISQSYRYTLCDAEGNPVDAQKITTNVEEVHLDVKIQRVKEVQLSVDVIYGGGADEDHTRVQLSTEVIRLSGGEAVMEELGDTIVLGKVHLAEITKSQSLTFPINLPEGVTNLTGVTEVEANIMFQGLSTREFTIEKIKMINVPEGMEAELITEKLQIIVRGPTGEVVNLTEDDISVSVDLSGAEADTSTFKATVLFDSEFPSVGALGAYTVSVIVRAK